MDRLQETLDPSLFGFAFEKAGQESISVIAEIASDLAQVRAGNVRAGFGLQVPGRNKVLPLSERKVQGQSVAADQPGKKRNLKSSPMDDLEKEISRLKLAHEAVRLDSAEAFVLEVTPAQLQQLGRSELVGRIRPNREHHAGART